MKPDFLNLSVSPTMMTLFGGVFALLLVASMTGFVLSKRVSSEGGIATVANLNARIKAWWLMIIIFAAAFVFGKTVTVVLFALTITASLAGNNRSEDRGEPGLVLWVDLATQGFDLAPGLFGRQPAPYRSFGGARGDPFFGFDQGFPDQFDQPIPRNFTISVL